jgi:transcription initiation factor TFIIIB Brf1 subunit/transcription initiation factor TFIIB
MSQRGGRWLELAYRRTFDRVYRAISEVAGELGLPQEVVARAVRLLSRLSPLTLWRLPVRERAVALLYLASDSLGARWTAKELEEACTRVGADCGMVRLIVRRVREELGMRMGRADVGAVVSRVSRRLGLPEHVESRAVELARAFVESGRASGRSTRSVAAAAVYLAAKEAGLDVGQIDVARAAGVCDVTVRYRAREMREVLGLTDVVY